MKSKDKVLVLGLNSVWQRTLRFTDLKFGEVNRGTSIDENASGKGVNCASVVKALGAIPTILQFCGGHTGSIVCQDLSEKGFLHVSIPMADHTRVCTTLLDDKSGNMTELIDPSPKVSTIEMEQLVSEISAFSDSFSGLAICGSFPENVDVVKLAKEVHRLRIPILVDGVESIIPIIEKGGVILKINKSELLRLTDQGTFEQAVKRCFNLYSPSLLAVTNEGGDAYLFSADRVGWRYKLPEDVEICNPLGAGDAVAGSFLVELLRGKLPVDAFHFALAVGTASCLTLLPSQFAQDKVLQIQSEICIEELKF